MAELQPNPDVAVRGDNARADSCMATEPYKRPRDDRHTHCRDHHAVQDGRRDHKSLDIDTSEGPMQLDVTPKAPETGATLKLEVTTVLTGEGVKPLRVIEAGTTDDDHAVKDGGCTGKVTAAAAPAGECSALARLEQVENALVEVRTIDDAKGLRDMAIAIEVVGKKVVRSREVVFKAAETRLLAEQAVGKMLQTMEKAEGGRPAENPSSYTTGLQTLKDLGLNRDQSSKWQKIADLPKATLAAYFEKARKRLQPVTTSGAVRLADAREKRATRRDARKDARPGGWAPATAAARTPASEEVQHRDPRPFPDVLPRNGGRGRVDDGHEDGPEIPPAIEAGPSSAAVGVGDDHDLVGAAVGGDVVDERPVRKRRRTASSGSTLRVQHLLRDLRDLGLRALDLDGAGITRVLREVEGLVAALSARIQEEHEAESEFDVAPDFDPTNAPGLPVDAHHLDGDGESWEEVE